MSLLYLVLIPYLLTSLAIILVVIPRRRQLGKETNLLEILSYLLLGPLAVGVMLVIRLAYPPSDDPFLLIYSRLSFQTGKSPGKILEEIRAAGETVGMGPLEGDQIDSLLEDMLVAGYARSKEVLLSELTENQISVLEVELEDESSSDVQTEESEGMRVETMTLYYRGNPPRKRGKWQWRFITSLSPIRA